VAALLSDHSRKPDARLEIVRAFAARLGDARPEASAAIGELLTPGATMRTRYLVASPVAEMARAGDQGAATRLAALLATDPDGAVRARAAEVAGGIAQIEREVAAAAADPEPRVREAALRTIAAARARSGEAAARARLADDPWTFVRTAAAGALASLPPSPTAEESLAKALSDRSPRVRAAAVGALAAHRATAKAPALVERIDDAKEDIEVKVAAARALGQMCARSATDILTTFASRGASSVADDDERSLGLAAIEALGHLHPPDLATRLAKARAPDANAYAKRAADAALRETELCR
jgi:HEAT repeat protein